MISGEGMLTTKGQVLLTTKHEAKMKETKIIIVIIITLNVVFMQEAQREWVWAFYLEAVDKQQVEFSAIFTEQKILLQVLQVVLNVSLHLVKTDG